MCIRKGKSLAQGASNWAEAVAGFTNALSIALSSRRSSDHTSCRDRVRSEDTKTDQANVECCGRSWMQEVDGVSQPWAAEGSLRHVFVFPCHSHSDCAPLLTATAVCPCQTPAQKGTGVGCTAFAVAVPILFHLRMIFFPFSHSSLRPKQAGC